MFAAWLVHDTCKAIEEVIHLDSVQLSLYNPKHRAALDAFYLPKEQQRNTALPREILEHTLQEPNREPILILTEENPVGFFVLGHGEMIKGYLNNPNAILLYAFSINHVNQGKGYAKHALLGLPDFVLKHFPEMNEIILTVSEENGKAKRLYEKIGFLDKGIRKLRTTGIETVLHYPLSPIRE